jgi:class 3 adenylate cyclase
MATINEKLLDEALAALETARAWSPRVVSKLESHIRSADDSALLRINPAHFAAEKGIGEEEAIDLFLHATAVGLFQMNWILLCPICSCVIESFRALKNLQSHCRCTSCHVDLVAALDDMIAVSFTINPAIRDTVFHHPESLSVEDYVYHYRSAPEGLIPDGVPFRDVQQHITGGLAFIEPGQTTTLHVDAAGGALRGSSVDCDAGFLFFIDQARPPAEQTIKIRCEDNACDPAEATIAPGKVTFEFASAATKRFPLQILVLPPGIDRPPTLHFAPFLSGKRLLTTQTFRDLFRFEVIGGNEGIGVKDIALLFTDLKGSTALYDRIGDLNAFSLVQQHFEQLQRVTAEHHGAVIKTIGDAVMAAFLDPSDAVGAALDMRSEIAAFNRRQPDKALILKIGVHKGAAIAVTLNDRLDYFGQTVNIAARVQGLADADEIFLSEDVYGSGGVQEQIAALQVEAETASLRGVEHDMKVFRIAPQASELAPVT